MDGQSHITICRRTRKGYGIKFTLSFSLHQATFPFFFQVDFIYYTGDLPPHNVWNQSRADQIYSINTINQWLATLFPNKTFYSAVGNHEASIIFDSLSRCLSHMCFCAAKLLVISIQHQMSDQTISRGCMKYWRTVG